MGKNFKFFSFVTLVNVLTLLIPSIIFDAAVENDGSWVHFTGSLLISMGLFYLFYQAIKKKTMSAFYSCFYLNILTVCVYISQGISVWEFQSKFEIDMEVISIIVASVYAILFMYFGIYAYADPLGFLGREQEQRLVNVVWWNDIVRLDLILDVTNLLFFTALTAHEFATADGLVWFYFSFGAIICSLLYHSFTWPIAASAVRTSNSLLYTTITLMFVSFGLLFCIFIAEFDKIFYAWPEQNDVRPLTMFGFVFLFALPVRLSLIYFTAFLKSYYSLVEPFEGFVAKPFENSPLLSSASPRAPSSSVEVNLSSPRMARTAPPASRYDQYTPDAIIKDFGRSRKK